ncbi:hypothetical protein [Thalassovita aquimarina]|uniref:Uncharacterized protein n=1 Tax=Thalassovita aquimarina TaxID=2785917 RepID=A0ABS5HS54_9RHOB|nr:hypothetical protein [Thalassovita aquimarina]MBR9651671.1 hypothetical protein [Thalassovita aquimarina]
MICCGIPNQTGTYYSRMRENAVSTRPYRAKSGAICPEGEKGCYME